jgi:hypothetical protein
MKKDIEDRLFGLESIIHELYYNMKLMRYMSRNLHKETYNLFNNDALYWIWGIIMGNYILGIYKVVNDKEKFSFQKIVNIAKASKCEIDFMLIDNNIKELTDEYLKTGIEKVRDKYIAHQDLGVEEIKTDLRSLKSINDKAIEIYNALFSEFKKEKVTFTSNIIDSFAEIFNTIDEYDEIKGFLTASALNGEKTVEINKISDIVKRRNDK